MLNIPTMGGAFCFNQWLSRTADLVRGLSQRLITRQVGGRERPVWTVCVRIAVMCRNDLRRDRFSTIHEHESSTFLRHLDSAADAPPRRVVASH
jgi:hypothetical protein